MSGHSSARPRAARRAPAWLAAPALLLALAGALLGQWQLDRAAASRALRERFAAGAELPPLELPAASAVLDGTLRYRSVELAGRYEPDLQLLLDNRIRDGVAGYEVLTPFRPDGGGPTVLVNRGWLIAAGDRRVLPAIDVAADARVVAGTLDRLPQPGLRLGTPARRTPATGVAVVSYPTAAELEALLARPVADYQLLLDAAAPDGYRRERVPPGIAPERNLAYAGQWFLLAAAAAAGALWVIVAAVRGRSR